MYDVVKVQQLQNKSHVRGVLFKEMHYGAEKQLERKRREMKAILDQQVEEKRKQKESERKNHQRIVQKEDQQIRTYYQQLQSREKKVMQNSYPQQSNRTGGSQVYESKVAIQQKYKKSKNNSGELYAHGDIPVMPVMQSSEKVGIPPIPQSYPSDPLSRQQAHHHKQSHQSQPHNRNHGQKSQLREGKNHNHNSAGHIPLLQLGEDQTLKVDRKRMKSKNHKQPKYSIGDEEFSVGASRQHTELKEIFGDINEELENENRQLKRQLKKNQEAISLLIGAVRSNAKFDKFRVQAERILHGASKDHAESRGKKIEEEAEKPSMLPKLKLRHQSIMHDYMFGAAKRAIIKGKASK